jgi:5-methyltetrahydrofolate--homocysteine methyltransferase
VQVLQSLFKVLAEGATEWLHEQVRKEYWGYAKDEDLTIPAMFLDKYSGIRVTVGSAVIPNQAINVDLHKLLQSDEIYISVNKDGETTPAASISGFFLAHPQAKQFSVGEISDEQHK